MRLLPLLLLCLALAVAVLIYTGLLVPSAATDEPGHIRLSGVVVANKVVLSSKFASRINILHVREGDWVTLGQEVARLDDAELQTQRDGFLAQLTQLEAKLAELEETVVLERERTTEQQRRAGSQLEAARSEVNQAIAELDQRRADDHRARELQTQKLAAQQEAERSATEVRVAAARLKTLQDRVGVAAADLSLANVSRRQETIAMTRADQTRAEIAAVRAGLAEVEVRLADTAILAPIAGILSLRVAQPGEVIRPGDPIVVLVDLDDVWVKTEIEETYVSRLVVGMPMTVVLLNGERIGGKITFLSPEAEFATQRDVDRVKRDVRTFGIRIALPNQERRLHPGMTAYALLEEAAVQGRLSR